MPILQETIEDLLIALDQYKASFRDIGFFLERRLDQARRGEFDYETALLQVMMDFNNVRPDPQLTESAAAIKQHYKENSSRNLMRRRRRAERKSGLLGDVTTPRPSRQQSADYIRAQNQGPATRPWLDETHLTVSEIVAASIPAPDEPKPGETAALVEKFLRQQQQAQKPGPTPSPSPKPLPASGPIPFTDITNSKVEHIPYSGPLPDEGIGAGDGPSTAPDNFNDDIEF